MRKSLGLDGPVADSPCDHAIVVVGCRPDQEDGSFLIQDTFSLPFLTASAAQLWDAGTYYDRKMNALNYPLYLPVTPEQVMLPLNSWYAPEEMEKEVIEVPGHYGLLDIAYAMNTSPKARNLPRFPEPYRPGFFRLVQVPPDKQTLPLLGLPYGIDLLETGEQKMGGRWIWVQYSLTASYQGETVETVFVWNAEVPAPTDLSADAILELEYLLAVYVRGRSGWFNVYGCGDFTLSFYAATRPVTETAKLEREPKTEAGLLSKYGLKTSLITSFSVKGFKMSLRHWPRKVKLVDLYAFMQQDVRHLLLPRQCPRLFLSASRRRKGTQRQNQSACRLMATLSSNEELIRACAGKINDISKKRRLEIVALSTFLPGLSSIAYPNLAARSTKALSFCARLAVMLKSDWDYPIHCVECVAGSLVDGLWPGVVRSDGTKVHVANILPREDALGRLISQLEIVAPKLVGHGISLSVELEPGPNFLINDLRALSDLCKLLDKSKILSEVGGVNLDVAHWSIAGIRPVFFEMINMDSQQLEHEYKPVLEFLIKQLGAEWRESIARIMRYVSHAHLSDHGPGHISDLALGRFHDPHYFAEWLEFLVVLTDSNMYADKFGGCVSIELEAVADLRAIRDSVRFACNSA